ncbi:hypothetical protein C5B42_04135 [Candidatus Cerribacteria bacterium 'Amazon FNV 2010 28 9']|uniref:Uncharacterized protein n=1 Tax=Candidatus Cerribacteria bacterium 'Amazon FNV 2010 28 9' TaxID=2081795 RepID=A0A317JPB3_9BACT|nr:MAG: hypothetical protein C5B42_04135 [Candidatus Cerribacteria bacterium 'Amazon FNV 2010 28 9']
MTSSKRPFYRLVVFSSFLFALLSDQVLKLFVSQRVPVTINTGISFGWLSGNVVVLGLIVIYIAFFEFSCRYWHKPYPFASGLVLGGALSNIIDRIVIGGVRDFLPVPFLGIQNNLADWWIVLGLAWILYQTTFRGTKQTES